MSGMQPPPEAAGWDVVRSPTRDAHSNRIFPVTLSARGAGKYRAALTINITPAAFAEGELPPWLKEGGKIWVLRGRGDFLGTLRLMPNGPTRVAGGARGSKSLRITLRPLEGHPEKGAPRTEVEFDYSDSWFDITLPDWHGLRSAKPAAPPAALPPQQGKPFTLAAGASSHPAWNSPKAAAQHAAAVKGGAR